MGIEEWKDIVGYEGLYQVSNYGRVKSLARESSDGNGNYARKERILKVGNARGYCRVILCNKGRKEQRSVHRLVARAFVSNPNNYIYINHKDEVKTNNKAENLEWCDDKYNLNYGTRNQRIGEAHSKPVIQKTLCGQTVREYPSARQAERETGINNSSIIRCIKGKNESAGGYTWENADKKRKEMGWNV